ncbi:methyl-accepting chemotaxis protein [Photobacterium rosenbergii]|uniref:Methyl-accepting chemotaxis protein n=1 Tax=Photobacterium rosenbergii TaxID=294936 RepID=A0ABU3ZIK8_9GAMM|nr:methyl-accepting chemotaxis protein [Photobacterium rosenbergii]MDV5169971.1 methyl-accepting chemotaxis protein [Photobacterium rosenbergii]
MFAFGFKRSLYLSVISMLALVLVIINYFTFSSFINNADKDLNSAIRSAINYEVSYVESLIEQNVRSAEQLVASFAQHDYQLNFFDTIEMAQQVSGLTKITLGFDDGRSYVSIPSESFPNGVGSVDSYDPRTRPWYQMGKRSSSTQISDVFFSRENIPLTGVIVPMRNGVLLSDIRLSYLQDAIEQMNVHDGAVSIITDESGLVLASTAEFAQTSSVFQASALASSNHSNRVEIGDQDWFYFSSPLQVLGKKWHFITFVDAELAYQPVYQSMWTLVTISLVIALLSIVALAVLLQVIYRPIISLKSIINDLSAGTGDLTQRLDVTNQDDLGQIAIGINKFIEKLQTMMIEVKAVSDNLSERVTSLRHHSQVSQQVLEQHLVETDSIVTAVEELSNSAGLVAANAKNSENLTNDANELGNQSQQTLQQALVIIESLVSDVESTSQNITDMESETNSIQSIATVIGEIAEQTNLLALNASIEAARAGEQGRGFAVVADEVRALAARTQQSTSEIQSTLFKLNAVSSDVVNAITRTKATCSDMVNETNNVSSQLAKLETSVDKTHELSAQISSSAGEQNIVITNINKNIHHIHAMVGQVQSEMNNQHQESEQIAVINDQLGGALSNFKI